MRVPSRTYWSFIAGLVALTFGAAQLWTFVLALRQGGATGAQAAIGTAGILLLVAGAIVVLRILYVTARPRRQQ